MKKKLTNAYFESLKSSIKTEDKGSYKDDQLTMEIGNTYLVRLIPNVEDPLKSIFHYYHHGWYSNSTSKYVYALSPKTYGETCPITEERMKIYNNGSEEENEAAKKLNLKESWKVNVYVIKDPTNPDNEGTVKILKMGKELHDIFTEATIGDDAEEFGVERVFNLTEDGCTFKLVCKLKGEIASGNKKQKIPTYVSSKFLPPSEIEGLDEDAMEKIYDGIFDLEKTEKTRTKEELVKMIQEHFYGESTGDSDLGETNEEDSSKKKSKLEDILSSSSFKKKKREVEDVNEDLEEESTEAEEEEVRSPKKENAKLKNLMDGIDDL